jgi:hypothetical protein
VPKALSGAISGRLPVRERLYALQPGTSIQESSQQTRLAEPAFHREATGELKPIPASLRLFCSTMMGVRAEWAMARDL